MAQKRRKHGKKSSRRRDQGQKGGSMSRMRSGFQNMAGQSQRQRQRQAGNRFLTVLLVIAVVILAVLFATR